MCNCISLRATRRPVTLAAAALLLACAAPESRSRTVSGGGSASATAAVASDSQLVARLDSFVRARAAADSFSGVVLVARGGVPVYRHVTGMADRATRAPNRLDTKFNLGSVDKYFTRIAIRQLQQAGKVRMSDLVGRYIPDYPNAEVRNGVTVAQLYEMTAGIPDIFNSRWESHRLGLRTTDDFIALFAADPLRFPPGSRRQYCNGCYVLLGKVIERASGQSYYDYVQERIFAPAGMRNTGYYELGGGTPNLAEGYTTAATFVAARSGMGSRERAPNTSMLGRRGGSVGGGYSTAEDLLALSRAVLAGRLLDAAHTDSLLGPEFRKAPPGEVLRSGWNGGAPGMNAVFAILSTGHVVVALSNYDPPAATRVGDVALRLIRGEPAGSPAPSGELRLLDPASPRAARARRFAELVAAGDSAGAASYLRSLGTPDYARSPGVATGVGRVSARVTPARAFAVELFEQEGPATIVWLRNAEGRYASIVLVEDGAGRVTGLALDSRTRPGPEP